MPLHTNTPLVVPGAELAAVTGSGTARVVAVWSGASPARNVMVMTVDRCGIPCASGRCVRCAEQHQQRVSQLDALVALLAAEGSQSLVFQLEHHLPPGGDGLDAAVCDAQLHRARVDRVGGTFDQTGAFQRSRDLGDLHRLQAGEVGQLALAGLASAARESIQRGQDAVLGGGQAKWRESSVQDGAPPYGQAPQHVASRGRRTIGMCRHTTIVHTMIVCTITISRYTIGA